MQLTNVKKIIQTRYSCRSYTGDPLTDDDRNVLRNSLAHPIEPPFGTDLRFDLIAKHEDDTATLKGLGTYGLLKGVPAYIAGVVSESPHAMEDFGYVMEYLVLQTTAMGLGTCWLGGTFTKSNFRERVHLQEGEELAALIAVGYPTGKRLLRERLTRRIANADHRLPWETLFFEGNFSTPLNQSLPDVYINALKAVRQGPSASNKQPWRIVKSDDSFHFYINRSRQYTRMLKTAGLIDLQRNDLGIAMCHFEQVLQEDGITGEWFHTDTAPHAADSNISYIVSWRAKA